MDKDGNFNCMNVVALDIARQMINNKIDSNTTENIDTNSEDVRQIDTCSDSQFTNGEHNSTVSASGGTHNNQTVDVCITPDQLQGDISCEDTESSGSFIERSDNSLHFVEYQQGFQGYMPFTCQQAMPYYLYNGQLYNTMAIFPYGQFPYPAIDCSNQNTVYYQVNQGLNTVSNEVNTTGHEQSNEIQFSSETGSHDVRNNIQEHETIVVPNTVLTTEQNPTNTISRQDTSDSGSVQGDNACLSYGQQYNPYLYGSVPVCPPEYQYSPGTHDTPLYHPGMFQQGITDQQKFQYPAIYVSTTGLITVLLKYDVSVEITVDQTLRLVSHQQKLVVSINSRGNASYLFHPAAHIMQDLTTTEAEIFLGRKVKMTTDNITFANNFNCYKFDYTKIQSSIPNFTDLSKDRSVSFLFTENTRPTSDLLQKCTDIVSMAEFERNRKGGICIRINGIKIVQTTKGDVIVTGKSKYLRMSPTTSVLRLDTNFVTMDIEMNWNIRIKRGSHTVNASHLGFVVSNGKIEAAFDEKNEVHACRLPHRKPLIIEDSTGHGHRRNSQNKAIGRNMQDSVQN